MKTEMLSTRIDHDTKVAFTYICDEVGLSPSQAIKLFAKAVINHGGIPFDLKAKRPNEDYNSGNPATGKWFRKQSCRCK